MNSTVSRTLTSLYPIARKAYTAGRAAYDQWNDLTPEEKARYMRVARRGLDRTRARVSTSMREST
jgi:hypothetical protein